MIFCGNLQETFVKLHAMKFVLGTLLFCIALPAGAQQTARSNRPVYIRSAHKVYVLRAPFNINKSQQQMQAESEAGRKLFGPDISDGAPVRHTSLLSYVTPIKDQAGRGTCVAFASVALVETMLRENRNQFVDLSEQYIFWASKALEHDKPHTEDSEPVDMLRAMAAIGVPMEAAWPYEKRGWYDDKVHHPDCFAAYRKNEDNIPIHCVTNGDPPSQARNAPRLRIAGMKTVPSSPEALTALLRRGIPVEVALDFYDGAWSFNHPESQPFKAGIVATPQPGDKKDGGHAVVLVGYDLDSQVYLFKNSWGTDDWGSQSPHPGFGVISMEYIRRYGNAVVAKLP